MSVDVVSDTNRSPKPTIGRLLRPRSVVVIGASPKPSALGNRLLGNLVKSPYAGDLYAVGRSEEPVHGRPCVTSLAELPEEIDLALLAVPGPALADTVQQCADRGIGGAVCYASGFGEFGEDGREREQALAATAAAGGVALLGPNCFGLVSAADEFSSLLLPMPSAPVPGPEVGRGIAILAQSGTVAVYISTSLAARDVPVSYIVTTGNEAGVSCADVIDYLVGDSSTGTIAVYSEQIKDPQRFLEAVQKATDGGKRVVLLHPGRSARGQAAAASHTGALATDHALMTAMVQRAGATAVDSLEELVDLSELLLRFPQPSPGGVGIITASGAMCAILTDAAEDSHLRLAELSGEHSELSEALSFTAVTNPLDTGTGPITRPEIMKLAVEQMLADPDVGTLLVSYPCGGERVDLPLLTNAIAGRGDSPKPMVYVIQTEQELPASVRSELAAARLVFHRSGERALRALATAAASARAATPGSASGETVDLPTLPEGAAPEWLGKQVLSSLDIPVPAGGLARTISDAVEIAAEVGYPVVAKAQAAELMHKTEAGGVVLGIENTLELRQAWDQLHAGVARVRPDLELDGILVEQMGAPGVEMVLGARRDPLWGPVILVGSGGIMVELLNDVRLMSADAPVEHVVKEIGRLRAAGLLRGFRGSPPADIEALAAAAVRLGQLMIAEPSLVEIDLNPVQVYPAGQGIRALDALVVTDRPPALS